MSKTNITIPFDEEKLSALDFSLQKENATAQQCMQTSRQSCSRSQSANRFKSELKVLKRFF